MKVFKKDLLKVWEKAAAEDKFHFSVVKDNVTWVAGITISADAESIEPYLLNESEGKFVPALSKVRAGNFFVIIDRVRSLRPKKRKKYLDVEQAQSKLEQSWPYLSSESSLMTFRIKKRMWSLHLNIAPIQKKGHYLVVPGMCGENKEDQTLTETFFEDMAFFALNSEDAVIYYNGLGAGASVDLFHFHLIYRDSSLPLFVAKRITASGYDFLQYPATVLVCATEQHKTAWEILRKLSVSKVPFNVIIDTKFIYIIPRAAIPAEVILKSDLGGFDFQGLLTLEEGQDIERINEQMIVELFASATIPRDAVINILEKNLA